MTILADHSDVVAEGYLEERDLSVEFLTREIRALTLSGKIVPVFAGSAKRDIGIQPLLDGIVRYLPSPSERGICEGHDPKSGATVEFSPDDKAFRGLVFKLLAGSGADLLYVRTYSGELNAGDTLLNPRTGEKVRAKRLLRLRSKNVSAVEKVGPGDIVGVIGPSGVVTGDTLCSVGSPVLLERIAFPEPVISIAVEPRSTKERARLDSALDII